MRNQKAYTLIEALLIILVLPLILTLTFALVKLLYRFDYKLDERQNFIGILQLRKRVAIGSDISIKGDALSMTYNNRNVELICQNDRLNEVEGYMEYLINIEECEWKTNDAIIYISYIYKGNNYETFIGYLK
jgi:competence protein ComGF